MMIFLIFRQSHVPPNPYRPVRTSAWFRRRALQRPPASGSGGEPLAAVSSVQPRYADLAAPVPVVAPFASPDSQLERARPKRGAVSHIPCSYPGRSADGPEQFGHVESRTFRGQPGRQSSARRGDTTLFVQVSYRFP